MRTAFELKFRKPTISVLLPVRNGMPYLQDAVSSILRQTLADFELLLIDDGSTDDTPAYCRSIDDPRVRHFRLEGGLVEALNLGLRESRAPVIARMDADDVSHPERLEKQFELMQRESLVLLSCEFDRIDGGGKIIGHTKNLLTDEAIRWRMLFTPAFVHPGAMFDKQAALRVGGYQPEFRVAQDFDLWTRLASCGRLGNHPETLLQYRVLESGVSASNREQQIGNAARIAARYVATLAMGVSEEEWYHLHRFSSVAEISERYSIIELANAFANVRDYFLERYGGRSNELTNSIVAFGRHLRWRSLQASGATGVAAKLQAIRVARAFDPDQFRILNLVKRGLGRLFCVRSRYDSDLLGPNCNRAILLRND